MRQALAAYWIFTLCWFWLALLLQTDGFDRLSVAYQAFVNANLRYGKHQAQFMPAS
jgi:hypothetical protein